MPHAAIRLARAPPPTRLAEAAAAVSAGWSVPSWTGP